MTSKYKKNKNKTRKILKGGTSSIIPELVASFDESEYSKSKTYTFYGPLKLGKLLFNEIKFSIDMINNVLLETGLYIRNVYSYGGESTLDGIIGDVCFDLFDKLTCDSKINEIMKVEKFHRTKTFIKDTPKQAGGSNANNDKQKSNIIEAITKYAKKIKYYNLSVDTFFTDNKDYIEIYIDKQFKYIQIEHLFEILKIMHIMNHLYDEKNIKIKNTDPLPIFRNEIMIGEDYFTTWNLCSKFHQGVSMNDDVDYKKKCKMDYDIMKNQGLYSYSNINYRPMFSLCFNYIANILKNYYSVEKMNDKPEFGDIKTVKPLEEDVDYQLKEVYKVIKFFKIDEQLKQIFLNHPNKDTFSIDGSTQNPILN